MKEVDIANVLRKHVVNKYKTQKAAAEAWGVLPSTVSMVLRGERQPTENMLAEVGYERLPYSPQYAKVKK